MGKRTNSENTHLLRKKYYCTDDILLNWFVFDSACKSEDNFNVPMLLSPNQLNWRSAVQRYFSLQSKWVFPGQPLHHHQAVVNPF